MERKNNFRARVMKMAWQIWKATAQSWSICMKKAWNLWRFTKRLREGVVKFLYRKADGTLRMATGTLCDLPSDAFLGRKRATKPAYKTITYYDLEKGAFRSFKIENLLGGF